MSDLERGIFIEPYRTDGGKEVATAYTHDGRKVAEFVLPDDSKGSWAVAHAHLSALLGLHSSPLQLVRAGDPAS